MPALHLAHDAALDPRVAERAAGERGARDPAARIDRPLHGDAALQRRVPLSLALVTRADGTEMGHDHAPHLLLREPALRCALTCADGDLRLAWAAAGS